MPQLIPAFARLVVRGEEAIHRALRAAITALIEQRGVDLGRREIHEARLV
jgi:hypothetical protein